MFALYVALYCLGRLAFEIIRIDDATRILGLRVNIFTSIIIGVAALVYFVVVGRLHPGRETELYRKPQDDPSEDDAAESVETTS